MLTLSIFQLLPPHVVKIIVDHVAGCSRLRYDRIANDSDEYKLLQMPLLWVCHNFRAFICARFCGKCELQLDEGRDRYVDSRPSWPFCLRKLDYPTPHLATDLYLNLSIWSIYTGTALQQLSSAPYEDCAFPLVRQLTIGLCLGDKLKQISESRPPTSLDSYPPDTTANIAAFIQRVRQMAPDIRKVDVLPDPSVQQLVMQRNAHTMDLLQQLYSIVKVKIATTYGSVILVEYLDLEPIHDLVRVDYGIYDTSSRIMPLLRRNAHTLQYLRLRASISNTRLDYTALIRDPDNGGKLVEYSCLHTLQLYSYSATPALQNSVSNGAVVFPSLLHLGIHGFYPFDDDVLFRGNAATLESLQTCLSPATVAILKRHKVFTPTSHPKLKYVNTDMRFSDVPSPFATAAEYLQFVLKIAPGASVRTIDNLSRFREEISQELGVFGNHADIQILSLPETTLSIWDTIGLIKSLPLLSDLESGIPTLGTHPQGVSWEGLPSYVHSTYAPMGKQFRCWRLRYYSYHVDYAEIATCVLLLALVCPNFDYAALNSEDRERFMQMMNHKLVELGYIQHVPRLRRLLFNGWKSC